MSLVFSGVPQWALDAAGKDATGRLVLFALGTFRRKGDGLCYPSQPTICKLTGLGERTVRVTLHRLVNAGALVVVRKATGTFPTVYALPVKKLTGNSSGSSASEKQSLDRQSVHDRGAETADELKEEHTERTTTARPVGSCSSNALAQSSSAADRPKYKQRRDPRQQAPTRVRVDRGVVSVGTVLTGLMDRLNAKRGVA